MKERQPLPDLLKGIAVIAMIQVHIMEQFARPEILAGTIGKVSLFLGGPFAAPVFMAVMGYFAGRHEGMGRWGRGLRLILLGILLNIGLNFNLLLHVFLGKSSIDPLPYIFGADILPLAGLSLIFIGLLEIAFRQRMVPALALAFLVAALASFIPPFPEKLKYLGAFIAGTESWSYFPLFPWLAYPLLGYGVKRLEIEMPSLFQKIRKHELYALILVIILQGLIIKAFNIITDLPSYYHHGIILFVWMVGFLYGWLYLVSVIIKNAADSQIIRYIRWLGEHVTLVYVVQWLIIGNLAYYFRSTQFILQLLLWFVGVSALTSGVVFLYLKMRIVWKRS
jgi:uncharacterized membrane protein